MLVAGALSSAQTTASTPDAFRAQVTGTTRDSYATDISANGRFVVFQSEGDAATIKPGQTVTTKSPANTDGNSEIFCMTTRSASISADQHAQCAESRGQSLAFTESESKPVSQPITNREPDTNAD